jgi:SP family facilitated glucose transporter-like MFS transporter 3
MNLNSSNADSPLLNPSSPSSSSRGQLSLRELFSNTSLRGSTILCAVIMALQQFGGINAVMFYSTPVLRPLLPNAAGLLGISITLVNAVMTLPAIFLVDVSPGIGLMLTGQRLGRRTLLVVSCAGMAVMSALLAIGLNNSYQILSAIAIISFIVSSPLQNQLKPGILLHRPRSSPIPPSL